MMESSYTSSIPEVAFLQKDPSSTQASLTHASNYSISPITLATASTAALPYMTTIWQFLDLHTTESLLFIQLAMMLCSIVAESAEKLFHQSLYHQTRLKMA